MFYEIHFSLSADLCKTRASLHGSWPHHAHNCFELILPTRASIIVTVNAHTYTVSVGQGVLIFPNQTHSVTVHSNAEYAHCLFSKELVNHFSQSHASMYPVENLFSTDSQYLHYLERLQSETSFDIIKGYLYLIVGDFDKQASYIETEHATANILLGKIFEFVSRNYKNSCTLKDLEQELGYNYVYLSRYFKSLTGITYNQYVQSCRITEACRLLQTSEKNLLDIAFECGYNSPRSFYRNFQSITHSTPSEYLEKHISSTSKDKAKDLSSL